jgi:hypothetical protein
MGDSHLGQTWTKNPGKMGEDREIGDRGVRIKREREK